MLDRESELANIQRTLERACRGSGRLLVIEGPAGIGKSTLLAEARGVGERLGMLARSARGTELESDHVFGVVRQLLSGPLLAVRSELRAELLSGPASRVQGLLGLATEVEARQGRPGAADVYEAPQPLGDPMFGLLDGLYWLCSHLAERGPILLCVDDLHWADAASTRFLAFLVERLDDLPIAIVLTLRTSLVESSAAMDHIKSSPLLDMATPGPLSATAIGALIRETLGATAAPSFIDGCVTATGGNPFLVRELLRALAAEELAPIAANTDRIAEVTPASVSEAVVRRLRTHGEAVVALAQATAIFGDGAALADVALLACTDESSAIESASTLATADILREEPLLTFVHPLVRLAVYESIPASDKSRRHRAAARILADRGGPTAATAAHLLNCKPAGQAWVVEFLRRAARIAVAHGSPEVAVTLLERARLEPPEDAVRSEVSAELLIAETRSPTAQTNAGYADLLDEVSEAIRDEPRRMARWAPTLAIILLAGRGRVDSRELLMGLASQAAATDTELSLRIRAELLTHARWQRPETRGSLDGLVQPEQLLNGGTVGERLMLAARAVHELASAESAAVGGVSAESAFPHGELSIEQSPESITVLMAINALIVSERYQSAERVINNALADAQRRGSEWAFAAVSLLRARLARARGDLVEAELDGRRALEIARTGGWLAFNPNPLGFLLPTLADRGEVETAGRELAHAELDDVLPDLQDYWVFLACRAGTRAAANRLGAALADFELADMRGDGWGYAPANRYAIICMSQSTSRGALLMRAGNRDAALETAERELMLARKWGAPTPHSRALRATAMAGAPGERVERLREAVRLVEGTEARLELARALVDLGACLRRSNHQRESRQPLERGYELAIAAKAAPLSAEASDELGALGRRPRRRELSGADALTASELRIARMAASGMSNPEIAQALFITRKTVEFHLGGAYRKLDIASRGDLAVALSTSRPARASLDLA